MAGFLLITVLNYQLLLSNYSKCQVSALVKRFYTNLAFGMKKAFLEYSKTKNVSNFEGNLFMHLKLSTKKNFVLTQLDVSNQNHIFQVNTIPIQTFIHYASKELDNYILEHKPLWNLHFNRKENLKKKCKRLLALQKRYHLHWIRSFSGSLFLNFRWLIQKYEYLWKIGFILVLAVAAMLFNKVYIFQTHPQFDGIREGNVTELLLFGLSFGFLFSLMDLYIHHVFDDLCMKYYITEQKYTQPESRKKRCYTLVKWAYSIIYYLISSLWCYKILCGTRFMPTWLGGQGSPYVLLQQGPRVLDITFEMRVFYICQFGKHFARFFGHVFIRPEGNFFEYALHHGLSVFLIVFSYLTNQWLIGLFVLFIHDYSDFALITARAYKDYKNYSKKLLDAIYVHAFIAWCGCRIFLFVAVCIYPAFYCCYSNDQNLVSYSEFQYSVLRGPNWFMVFMMAGLQVLHLFWTYYIAESFVSVKISSKAARHSYD